MNIKLTTSDDKFITDAVIPDFEEPPKVVVWGDRIFVILGRKYGEVKKAIDSISKLPVYYVYRECFAYILPPVPNVKGE